MLSNQAASRKTIDGVSYYVADSNWWDPFPVSTGETADVGTTDEALRLLVGTQQVSVLWSPYQYNIGGFYSDTFTIGESVGVSRQDSSGGNWDWFTT